MSAYLKTMRSGEPLKISLARFVVNPRHRVKMEHLNGEIKDREQNFWGLKTPDSPILKGYQLFHNYVRPHEGLGGKTPSEAAGVKVEGENKWLTLIENASARAKNNPK
ncbi:MAG: hypothetical protein JRN51_07250 [Nitrososphaerota archaeon]|nr:hypothetical protein [Nitrososphaerota archaeon]